MLLGIVLHTALFLIPLPAHVWGVQDPLASIELPYDELVDAIHGFRMPVFFMLSGFFTAMLWRRRGLRGLVAQRLKRIGAPLAAACVTVIPVSHTLLSLWSGADLYGGFDPMNPIAWLVAWLWSFWHLWFLWQLLLLVAFFALAVWSGFRFSHKIAWWGLIPLSVLPYLLMNGFGADTYTGLIPAPHVLLFHAIFFLFGAFLYQRNIVVGSRWALVLAPTLLVLFPVTRVFVYEQSESGSWTIGATAILQSAYTWLMCLGLLGLFRLIASRERFWVRYLSDASYWMYLWHLPLVLVAQVLVREWALDAHVKFALICVTVTLILLATYQLGVRYTPIGTMLNGRRVRGSKSAASPVVATPRRPERLAGSTG